MNAPLLASWSQRLKPPADVNLRIVRNAAPGHSRPRRLGDRLVAVGALDPDDLVRALAIQARQEGQLGEILVSRNMTSRAAVRDMLSEQWDSGRIDLAAERPDGHLVDRWGIATCLADGLVPWRRVGAAIVIVTARPYEFAEKRAKLEAEFGKVLMAVADEDEIISALTGLRSTLLAERSETRVPEADSCRALDAKLLARGVALVAVGLAAAAVSFPQAVFTLLTVWAGVSLLALAGLKAVALGLSLRSADDRAPNQTQDGRVVSLQPRQPSASARKLPIISIMIPLFHEQNIATQLLKRLEALRYPRDLTDILLVCEEDDALTADALARTALPPWIRVVTVPRGRVQTKPRALNYALDFCRGGIIGIWDAEDAPAPDQLHVVARSFRDAEPEVACFQGVLDYYNSRTNLLSRCFTIEYAAWFRVILPALEYLNLPLPLGGTTVFLRRAVLNRIGGWDSHNVTEDADLGIRLARHGYRTRMMPSVTYEEANCAVLPWIKQRSRWLKGYALTYAVHMRRPVSLWRDLGARGFVGVQIVFLATLSQFLLAPILLSCWGLGLGLWSVPLASSLLWSMVTLTITAEVISVALAVKALKKAEKIGLAAWIPALWIYFPMAVVACYKGLFETLRHPFYWHKTRHGLHEAQGEVANAF